MNFNWKASELQDNLFEPNSRRLKVCLFLMFLLATLVRLDQIRAPGLLLDREYTSAIFARAYFLTHNPAAEDWRRDNAIITKNQQPVLEPPLVEYLVSLIYRIVGKEEIFYARYLTNAFWLVGGIFMYLIAKRLLSADMAVVATAYYLFVPMGILISRSFQPDSLMIMLFLICLYLLICYFENPSSRNLLLASAMAALTLSLRPLVLFAIFGAFVSLSLYKNQSWRKVINVPLMIFSGISVLPAIAYYGYGIIFAGFMRWKISTSFMPYLLVKKDFWLGWFELGAHVAGYSILIAAIIGFFFLQNKIAKYLVVGLTASYAIFGIASTYHIHTHSYYHIQLFPILGLCIAPLVVGILKALRPLPGKTWVVPLSAILLITLYHSNRQVRDSLYQVHLEDPGAARAIGEIVHHSPRTVFVSYYYGVPLEYYGEFAGAPWPVRIEDPFYRAPNEIERSVQERIVALGFSPEYFVITNFDLYDRKHQDLRSYLEINCSMLAQTPDYLIYRSCQTVATE